MLYILVYMLIGIIAGTLSGMLGIGGGVIVIPLLLWTLKTHTTNPDVIMQMAAGTSLAVMIFNTSSGAYTHFKRGSKIWPVYRKLVPGIILGTITGVIFASSINSKILEIIFGIFIILVALNMLLMKRPKPTRHLPGPFGTSIVGFIIGGKSGMLGLGGGVITNPFLYYCNVSMRDIVGISNTCSATIATIGTIGFMLTGSHVSTVPPWSIGFVYLPAVLGILLTGPICAHIGAHISHKLPKEMLKKILAIVLLLVAIKMLI